MPKMALLVVCWLDSCTATCAGISSCLHTVQLELADQGKSVEGSQGLANKMHCVGVFLTKYQNPGFGTCATDFTATDPTFRAPL